MTDDVCGHAMSTGERCGRPAGHWAWSLEVGWPRDTVTVYAHSASPQPYDAEVAPYLTDGSDFGEPA